MHGECAARAA